MFMGSLTFKLSCGLLINCLVLVSLVLGQSTTRDDMTAIARTDRGNAPAYLIDISAQTDASSGGSFQKEAGQIANVLSSANRKSPVVIDDGTKREAILHAAAVRLAELHSEKSLFRIDWNSLFANSKNEEELNNNFGGILKLVRSSKGKLALFIDDIAILS